MLLANCPVSITLRAVGGKWKPLILRELKNGPVRFGALQRRVPEASRKVLTEQLRQLESYGLVEHRVYAGKIVRSEYALSEYGATLRPLLLAMAEWGTRHRRLRSGRPA